MAAITYSPRLKTSVAAAPTGAPMLLATALIMTAVPLVLHLSSQTLAIGWCVLASLFVAQYLPSAVPAILFTVYLFQNLFVSLLSPEIPDLQDFNLIRSYNFITTAALWLCVAAHDTLNRHNLPPPLRRMMDGAYLGLIVIAPFFAVGLLLNPTAAVIYLRNIATPLMFLHICMLCAYRGGDTASGVLKLLAYGVLLLGYAEWLWRDAWLALTNGYSYWELNSQPLRESGFFLKQLYENGKVLLSIKDGFQINLLNSEFLADIGFKVYRLMGPNMHAISFGYALAFLICFMGLHGRWLYVALALPLLIMVSAKGAIIVVLFVGGAYLISKLTNAPPLFYWLCGGLGLYACAAVTIGLLTGDYHAIGLTSGIVGFLGNPIGHGLGAGGNLSGNFAALDWRQAQEAGQFSGAAESAIGVLLYQMGVAGLFLLALYFTLSRTCWEIYQRNKSPALALAALSLLAILVNGLLQEEALFAPLALAFMAGYAGLCLGQTVRERQHLER